MSGPRSATSLRGVLRSTTSKELRLGAALVVVAVCGGLAACGDNRSAVPPGDATAIFAALRDAQAIGPQTCGGVSRPVTASTRAAYALMIRVSAANPEAELQSPDFADHHPPIRSWLAGAAQGFADCRGRVPATGRGWRALQARLEQAAGGASPP